MKVGLSKEISEDILEKSYIITGLSDDLASFYEEVEYGTGVQHLVIGVICVSPEFDFFFKTRRKYTKKKKLLEYDIKLEYQTVRVLEKMRLKAYILDEIAKSFHLVEGLGISDFDVKRFEHDFYAFIQKIS